MTTGANRLVLFAEMLNRCWQFTNRVPCAPRGLRALRHFAPSGISRPQAFRALRHFAPFYESAAMVFAVQSSASFSPVPSVASVTAPLHNSTGRVQALGSRKANHGSI